MVGGTDQMGFAHFSRGMKAVRIDAALVDSFAAQRIARLSTCGATIVAIKVDNRVADAAVAVEPERVIRPFLAGGAGQDCFASLWGKFGTCRPDSVRHPSHALR